MTRNSIVFLCACFGLLASQSPAVAGSVCTGPANLIANCGFETGDFSSWSLSGVDVPSAAGNLYGVEGTDPDGTSPDNGNYQAFFADQVANMATLMESFATVTGASYQISWNLAQDTAVNGNTLCGSAQCTNRFSGSFDGAALTTLTAVPVQGYTTYSFSGTANSAVSNITFTFGNDLGTFLFDDVSATALTATPEPSSLLLLLSGGIVAAALIFAARR